MSLLVSLVIKIMFKIICELKAAKYYSLADDYDQKVRLEAWGVYTHCKTMGKLETAFLSLWRDNRN